MNPQNITPPTSHQRIPHIPNAHQYSNHSHHATEYPSIAHSASYSSYSHQHNSNSLRQAQSHFIPCSAARNRPHLQACSSEPSPRSRSYNSNVYHQSGYQSYLKSISNHSSNLASYGSNVHHQIRNPSTLHSTSHSTKPAQSSMMPICNRPYNPHGSNVHSNHPSNLASYSSNVHHQTRKGSSFQGASTRSISYYNQSNQSSGFPSNYSVGYGVHGQEKRKQNTNKRILWKCTVDEIIDIIIHKLIKDEYKELYGYKNEIVQYFKEHDINGGRLKMLIEENRGAFLRKFKHFVYPSGNKLDYLLTKLVIDILSVFEN